eukprot:Skav235317  [mRNA]  locus=scaffold520:434017:434724:+ [translate_table: standard]
MQHIQNELASLGKWCQAMVESTEKATATQEERMTDVRRQTMLIMDIVSSTQDAITQSSESLQHFTQSQFLQNSSANLETNLREVILHEMNAVKTGLLDDGAAGANLKTAIVAMVERLDEGVKRLELNSEMSAAGVGGGDEEMRQELSALAQALAQQQEANTQSLQYVSEFLHSELSKFKDTQNVQAAQISDSVNETVSNFSEQVNQNLARVEASLDKFLDAKAESGRKARGSDRG